MTKSKDNEIHQPHPTQHQAEQWQHLSIGRYCKSQGLLYRVRQKWHLQRQARRDRKPPGTKRERHLHREHHGAYRRQGKRKDRRGSTSHRTSTLHKRERIHRLRARVRTIGPSAIIIR